MSEVVRPQAPQGTRVSPVRIAGICCVLALLLCHVPTPAANVRDLMRFAADMALASNWREAKFRWQQADRAEPGNPKILNNLAVALEALGEIPQAKRYYEAAAEASGGHPEIMDNLRRHGNFWRRYGKSEDPDEAEANGDAQGDRAELARFETKGGRAKLKGKSMRVTVQLPVPPRLEIVPEQKVLIASFLAEETPLIDTNRELVRYLRNEFRKDTDLDVLDINPPPAVPEQTVEDLVANGEFWQHLGRNYDADLVVSGVIRYDREDASTFRDVDIVSAQTGQKVRQSRFVEQEQFTYTLDVFFLDGATGELRFRDRFRRAVVYQGLQNDPITAFYALSESISLDVLSVVSLRRRADTRVVYRK